MSRQEIDNLGVSAFCESMAMMAQSGIQTDEMLSLLQSSHESTPGPLENALSGMRKAVDAGESLSSAMEESGVFPDYAVKMIRTGEDSGHLENILFRLSRYYANQKKIADKLKNAITYPAAMMILIILVLAAMLALVLPSFREVYETMSGSISASSFRYIHWAYAICWIALGVMSILALSILVGALLWKNGHREKIEPVLSKIPITARILESMGMFRFTDVLGTFLASGKMQDEAVLDSIPMTKCAVVEEKLKKTVRSMEEGHGISQAALDADLFEPIYGRMLLAGERSGNLESVLERLTEHLEQNCGDLVDCLVSVVDPLLSGVLMVTVGLSLLSVMLPLIGMMSSIG